MRRVYSVVYEKSMYMAFTNEELFPHTCLEILKEVYKGRLELISFGQICKIMEDMIATWTDADWSREIKDVVNDWMNDN